MTRDRRLVLLLIILMAYGLFVVECRYRQHEDTPSDIARHRHRHRHETTGRRNHHDPPADRRSWSQELDYEDEENDSNDDNADDDNDDSMVDREDRDNEDDQDENEEVDDDYDARAYHERSYPRSSRSGYHGRMFEPRYPPRYHRVGYRGGWYEDEKDRRRGSSRYAARNHRFRTDKSHRRIGYPRNRDASDFDYDPEEEELDYERQRRFEDQVTAYDKHHGWWKSTKKHRNNSRRDWRHRVDENSHRSPKRHHGEDNEGSVRYDDRGRRSNATESRFFSKHDGKKRHEDDYEYRVDTLEDVDKDEEEEEDLWKEADSEDDNEEEEDLENDFYKIEKKAPLKTYDDIIRRLTSDDPTTSKSTVKRDYRNIAVEKYIRRDAFGNFKYEPRNTTRPMVHNRTRIASAAYVDTTTSFNPRRKSIDEHSPARSVGSSNDRRGQKDAIGIVVKGNDRGQEKKAVSKIDDTLARTKSLEQDYDEYLNTPDNEKEEDLIKAGVEEDSGMQADVTNTDYSEDENLDEDETPATFTTSTTTTTTTTTTTPMPTTTTPKTTQHYDYRDPRAYEGGTGAQYNGYQSKNDYPPMSAHSAHKWQSLGTRESVKETRSNMQQYNKNGKSAEIREAVQHAIKVFKEGSCQWPRARVIPVRDVYPSPSTTYIPHCAILHRCSDDTGCCRSEALTCVPKHSHRVELSFYTTNVGGTSVVEKLSFYNHTECECKERTEYESANEKPSEQRVYRHYQSSPQPQNMRRPPPRKPCRCPSEFTPRLTPEGECQCNCYENHQNCIKTRRGKGYFSLADRLCIQTEECATPSCEFGEYMRRQGKCPRKKDKFDAIANFRANLSHRYRS